MLIFRLCQLVTTFLVLRRNSSLPNIRRASASGEIRTKNSTPRMIGLTNRANNRLNFIHNLFGVLSSLGRANETKKVRQLISRSHSCKVSRLSRILSSTAIIINMQPNMTPKLRSLALLVLVFFSNPRAFDTP